MTVAELIEALKAMPQDARVLVDGYEGGYQGLYIETEQVYRQGPVAWYYGPWDDVASPVDPEAAKAANGGEPAVILRRGDDD